MASNFGRVVPRHGKGREGRARSGWCIDFGRLIEPRYLTSARGAKFESREMAQAVLDAIRVKLARGVEAQAAVDEFAPTSSERNSVAHWLAEYLERQAERCDASGISPNTLYELRRCVRADVLPFWDGSSLSDVDALSIDSFSRWLARERGLAPKTVRNTLGCFRAFLRWLARMERLDRVPEFPVVSVPDYSPTIISQRTQALVLAEIADELRGAFLAACHGVRPGELRALDASDVQERDGVPGLLVRKAVKGPNAGASIRGTKTGDASWVPIDEELTEWIVWRLEQREGAWASPALFVNPRSLVNDPRNPARRLTANKLREVWNAAAARVGVRVRLYEGCKHSSATAWRSHGMSLELVRRMLRHRDSRSTERYGKLADGALVEAFRRTPKR